MRTLCIHTGNFSQHYSNTMHSTHTHTGWMNSLYIHTYGGLS
jgi:hypothetical protein